MENLYNCARYCYSIRLPVLVLQCLNLKLDYSIWVGSNEPVSVKWLATKQLKYPCSQLEKSYWKFYYTETTEYGIRNFGPKSTFHLHILRFSCFTRLEKTCLTAVKIDLIDFHWRNLIQHPWNWQSRFWAEMHRNYLQVWKNTPFTRLLHRKTSPLINCINCVFQFHQFCGINTRESLGQ